MKYATNSYLLIKFSRVGMKKKTKTFTSFGNAKDALDKYLKKHSECSAVITRVLYNSEDVNDKWGYNPTGEK